MGSDDGGKRLWLQTSDGMSPQGLSVLIKARYRALLTQHGVQMNYV